LNSLHQSEEQSEEEEDREDTRDEDSEGNEDEESLQQELHAAEQEVKRLRALSTAKGKSSRPTRSQLTVVSKDMASAKLMQLRLDMEEARKKALPDDLNEADADFQLVDDMLQAEMFDKGVDNGTFRKAHPEHHGAAKKILEGGTLHANSVPQLPNGKHASDQYLQLQPDSRTPLDSTALPATATARSPASTSSASYAALARLTASSSLPTSFYGQSRIQERPPRPYLPELFSSVLGESTEAAATLQLQADFLGQPVLVKQQTKPYKPKSAAGLLHMFPQSRSFLFGEALQRCMSRLMAAGFVTDDNSAAWMVFYSKQVELWQAAASQPPEQWQAFLCYNQAIMLQLWEIGTPPDAEMGYISTMKYFEQRAKAESNIVTSAAKPKPAHSAGNARETFRRNEEKKDKASTAETAAATTKAPQKDQICFNFINGTCYRGDRCRFSHSST
jgi:hypothetical protein